MSNYFDNKQLFNMPETTQYGSHMIMTNIKKESKFKYINIDTRFSDNYNYLDNTANYNITLPDKLNNVKSMSVTNVELPVSYYNISSAIGNNIFYVTNTSTNVTTKIILPDSQYTTSSLITAINTLLPANLTFNINASGYSTFTTTTIPYTINFNVDDTGDIKIAPGNNKLTPKFKLGWVLGFRSLTYAMSTSKTITSEYTANIVGPKYVYLVIDEYQNGNQNSFISLLSSSLIKKNIIARVTTPYNIYPYGTVIPANLSNGLLTTDTRSYTGKIDIQRLNIQIIDENGHIMNLNGEDVSFCLVLEYE